MNYLCHFCHSRFDHKLESVECGMMICKKCKEQNNKHNSSECKACHRGDKLPRSLLGAGEGRQPRECVSNNEIKELEEALKKLVDKIDEYHRTVDETFKKLLEFDFED